MEQSLTPRKDYLITHKTDKRLEFKTPTRFSKTDLYNPPPFNLQPTIKGYSRTNLFRLVPNANLPYPLLSNKTSRDPEKTESISSRANPLSNLKC